MGKRQAVLLLILFFLLGVFAAPRLPAGLAHLTGQRAVYEFFDPITEVFAVIHRVYVDKPDAEGLEKMQLGAINGMLDALNDRYTQYIPPADSAAFEKDLTGQFVGIGAEVITESGWLTIVSPLEDSPAAAAGIRPQDRVVEIEGKSTFNVSVDESISWLTGTPGTPVRLTIERGPIGAGERIEKTIVRAQIVVKAVKGLFREPVRPAEEGQTAAADPRGGRWNYIIDPGAADGTGRIAYLRLSQFTPNAAAEFAGVLLELGADKPLDRGGLGGLIIDLRGDPGGMLDPAVAIVDMFLDRGTIVSIRGRDAEETYVAKRGNTFPNFPILVLVNGASASASEIVAGSLADNDRAVVLGTRTFGKGLVQSVQSLRALRGSQLKFTSARYYLPSGRLIQRTDDSPIWGVDPTPGFHLPLTDDEQIERLRTRREWDIFQNAAPAAMNDVSASNGAPRWTDPDWIEETFRDKQLAAALRAVRTRIAGGTWQPVTDVDAQTQLAQVSMRELERLELGRERLLRELDRVGRQIESLEAAAAGERASRTRPRDLWSDDVDLTDGRVKVLDKDGNIVRTLRITGPDLERWLMDANVAPEEPAEAAPAQSPGER